jgi:S1-C subfamily serine protease
MKQKKKFLVFLILLLSFVPSASQGSEIDNALTSNLIITSGDSVGTGIAIEKNKVLTAAHVVDGNKSVTLTISDRNTRNTEKNIEIKGEVLSVDIEKDLALIYSSIDLIPIVKSKIDLTIGQTVFAIGAPNNYIQVTKGVISALFQENGIKYIQTDAAINPGNSGGALISEVGNLIGIVVSRSKSQEGIGFAVSIESIESWLVTANKVGIPKENERTAKDSDMTVDSVLKNEKTIFNNQISILVIPILILFTILILNTKNRAKRKKKSRHFNITFND